MAERDDTEIVLTGGNMTPVVRVGDTVRRAAGPWTPTVHALLRHLRARGFTRAPEPLGIDERGREILSFLPGRVGTYPLDDFMLADATLTSVAGLLRAFHAATAGFESAPDAVWQWRAHCAAPGSPDTWLACRRGSCQDGVGSGEGGAGVAG
jgi:hypothetical protein